MGIHWTRHRQTVPKSSTTKKELSNTPVNILMKLLMQITTDENGTAEGISRDVFTRYVFKEYPDLSNRMFNYLANDDNIIQPLQMITQNDYEDRIETLMNNTSYESIFNIYATMYCGNKETVTPEEFQPIISASYNIFVDNHPDGPQICPNGVDAIETLLEGMFRKRPEVKLPVLLHMTEQSCPRLINMLHSFVVHKLRTTYRDIVEPSHNNNNNQLEEPSDSETSNTVQPVIAPSKVWLLSTLLPPVFLYPHKSGGSQSNTIAKLSTQLFQAGYADFSFPTHWSLLYNSEKHGCSANRFLHHVFDYKGPTLMFILGKRDRDICICISEEWRESPAFWGDTNCYLIQLSPVYRVITKGPRIVYVNFSTRGVFHGLQFGSNPTDPTVVINDSLDRITYNGKKLKFHNIEVWGCGAPQAKELQMDIKKWNSQQNEMRSVTKSTDSNWNENPDRQLLNYSNSDYTSGNQ